MILIKNLDPVKMFLIKKFYKICNTTKIVVCIVIYSLISFVHLKIIFLKIIINSFYKNIKKNEKYLAQFKVKNKICKKIQCWEIICLNKNYLHNKKIFRKKNFYNNNKKKIKIKNYDELSFLMYNLKSIMM